MKKTITLLFAFLLAFTSLMGLVSCSNDENFSSTSSYSATVGEQNALESATRYINALAISKQKVIEQLELEGYNVIEIEYALNNCGVNWNNQALKAANNALEISGISKLGIIRLLTTVGFTKAEAEYAANHCGANWKEQAVRTAKEHLDFSSYSKDELVELLKDAGFTVEEANYGAEEVYK